MTTFGMMCVSCMSLDNPPEYEILDEEEIESGFHEVKLDEDMNEIIDDEED